MEAVSHTVFDGWSELKKGSERDLVIKDADGKVKEGDVIRLTACMLEPQHGTLEFELIRGTRVLAYTMKSHILRKKLPFGEHMRFNVQFCKRGDAVDGVLLERWFDSVMVDQFGGAAFQEVADVGNLTDGTLAEVGMRVVAISPSSTGHHNVEDTGILSKCHKYDSVVRHGDRFGIAAFNPARAVGIHNVVWAEPSIHVIKIEGRLCVYTLTITTTNSTATLKVGPLW
jgi:hypothetical protein